jgi:hypothetical protein
MGIYNGAVLQTTDDTGAPFRLAPGVWQIRCSVHAGGTWQLEYRRDAADAWVPTDAAADFFTGTRTLNILVPTIGEFRLNGGLIGAQIEAIPTEYGLGGPNAA